jgi:hypothetical protein
MLPVTEPGQRDRPPVLVSQGEVRSGLAWLRHDVTVMP